MIQSPEEAFLGWSRADSWPGLRAHLMKPEQKRWERSFGANDGSKSSSVWWCRVVQTTQLLTLMENVSYFQADLLSFRKWEAVTIKTKTSISWRFLVVSAAICCRSRAAGGLEVVSGAVGTSFHKFLVCGVSLSALSSAHRAWLSHRSSVAFSSHFSFQVNKKTKKKTKTSRWEQVLKEQEVSDTLSCGVFNQTLCISDAPDALVWRGVLVVSNSCGAIANPALVELGMKKSLKRN